MPNGYVTPALWFLKCRRVPEPYPRSLRAVPEEQAGVGGMRSIMHGPFSAHMLRRFDRYCRGFAPMAFVLGAVRDVRVGASTRGSTMGLRALTLITPYPVGVDCTFPKDMTTVYADASDAG
jgi:hypothetical protein